MMNLITPLHPRIGLFSATFLALLLLGCTALRLHAADEAEKFAPIVPAGNLKEDVAATPLIPDFTTVVAKEAGLWPNIVCLPDGTLLAFGYNAPAHTTLPGDVDVWASTNGGRSWTWRGAAARRPMPTANYCHWASGMTKTGDVIVVAGGLADPPAQKTLDFVMTFISQDAGKTWEKRDVFPHKIKDSKIYPFGSVANGADGSLRTVVYSLDDQKEESAWMVTSRDNGNSWDQGILIDKGINESVLHCLGNKSWLCVARTSNRPPPENGQELRQFRSTDDGRTWTDEGLLTGFHKHPPSLIRLKDNRLVLTYGNRQNGNIEARLSDDDGKTWGAPLRLFQASGDMGYPATVQLSDGKLVTVFYAKQSTLHDGYHMGAIGWQAP